MSRKNCGQKIVWLKEVRGGDVLCHAQGVLAKPNPIGSRKPSLAIPLKPISNILGFNYCFA